MLRYADCLCCAVILTRSMPWLLALVAKYWMNKLRMSCWLSRYSHSHFIVANFILCGRGAVVFVCELILRYRGTHFNFYLNPKRNEKSCSWNVNSMTGRERTDGKLNKLVTPSTTHEHETYWNLNMHHASCSRNMRWNSEQKSHSVR